MTQAIQPPTSDAARPDPVAGLLDRLERQAYDELPDLLTPDVWLRALLPKRLVEGHTAGEAVDAFRSWFGDGESQRLVDAERETIGGRELVRYRLVTRPRWDRGAEWVVEQSAYCKVENGKIRRIDLVCSGFFPLAVGDGGLRGRDPEPVVPGAVGEEVAESGHGLHLPARAGLA